MREATMSPVTIDPLTIIDRLEQQRPDADDPYWVRVEALTLAALESHFDPDDSEDARQLRPTRGGLALETASRHVGFQLGVEHEKKRCGR
jgi:hypothetical protein